MAVPELSFAESDERIASIQAALQNPLLQPYPQDVNIWVVRGAGHAVAKRSIEDLYGPQSVQNQAFNSEDKPLHRDSGFESYTASP